MKHKFNKRFEEERSQRPIIASTLNTLSANGGKKNIQQYTQSVSTHFETLKSEYIEDKERALWQMRMYRLKKRALDKAVQCVIDKCGKRDIVIGIGDAGPQNKVDKRGLGGQAQATPRITPLHDTRRPVTWSCTLS